MKIKRIFVHGHILITVVLAAASLVLSAPPTSQAPPLHRRQASFKSLCAAAIRSADYPHLLSANPGREGGRDKEVRGKATERSSVFAAKQGP